MKKLFIDLETTGTDYRKHGIHQIAGLIEIDDEVVDEFDLKVRPHPRARIEEAAMAACNVDELTILAYPPMKEVHREFKELICTYVDKYDKKDKFHMVGFNINYFDNPFLRMWFRLCGDEFIGSLFWVDNLDVMSLAAEYLLDRRPDMPSFKLHRVATTLGIVIDKSKLHDAKYDVELTRKIYRIVTGRDLEI